MAYGEGHGQKRARRGRLVLITLLVLLVVFGGLFAIIDRVAVGMAEQRISNEVGQELSARGVTSSTPEVDVSGFPFLTQVVDENFQSVDITLRDVSTARDTAAIRLPELDVNLRDVSVPLDVLRGGSGEIVAKAVEGTATVGYSSVVKLMKQPDLRLAERNGKLVATLPVELLGQRFTLTGVADVVAAKDKIQLRFKNLTADGLPDNDVANQAVRGYAKDLSIDVPLTPLPFGIAVYQVRPLPEGLAITAGARNVPLNRAIS